MKKKLDQYLKFMLQKNASDLHIKALSGIRVRIDGVLTNFGEEKFSKTQMERLVEEITDASQLETLLIKLKIMRVGFVLIYFIKLMD